MNILSFVVATVLMFKSGYDFSELINTYQEESFSKAFVTFGLLVIVDLLLGIFVMITLIGKGTL